MDSGMTWSARFSIGAGALAAACFAGFLHGKSLSLHDEEMFFHEKNPDGTLMSFQAARAMRSSCTMSLNGTWACPEVDALMTGAGHLEMAAAEPVGD